MTGKPSPPFRKWAIAIFALLAIPIFLTFYAKRSSYTVTVQAPIEEVWANWVNG